MTKILFSKQTQEPDPSRRRPLPDPPAEWQMFLDRKMSRAKWNTWVSENCLGYYVCTGCKRHFIDRVQYEKHHKHCHKTELRAFVV